MSRKYFQFLNGMSEEQIKAFDNIVKSERAHAVKHAPFINWNRNPIPLATNYIKEHVPAWLTRRNLARTCLLLLTASTFLPILYWFGWTDYYLYQATGDAELWKSYEYNFRHTSLFALLFQAIFLAVGLVVAFWKLIAWSQFGDDS